VVSTGKPTARASEKVTDASTRHTYTLFLDGSHSLEKLESRCSIADHFREEAATAANTAKFSSPAHIRVLWGSEAGSGGGEARP